MLSKWFTLIPEGWEDPNGQFMESDNPGALRDGMGFAAPGPGRLGGLSPELRYLGQENHPLHTGWAFQSGLWAAGGVRAGRAASAMSWKSRPSGSLPGASPWRKMNGVSFWKFAF